MVNIVKPHAFIMNPPDGVALLRSIEFIARISHRSEEAQTEESWSRFIRSVVLNHGDWSVVEHFSISVEAEVDRGITHEWVRHRLGSYTQESTRFVNYEKPGYEARFICPFEEGSMERLVWAEAMDYAENYYRILLERGVSPQLARSVLPNSLASKIIVTYNLRQWRQFLIMRTTREAHPQMREVTVPLLWAFQNLIPILFEDIEPGMKQSEAIKLPR